MISFIGTVLPLCCGSYAVEHVLLPFIRTPHRRWIKRFLLTMRCATWKYSYFTSILFLSNCSSMFRCDSSLLFFILQPPYSLPYSEFVSSDPSFEDMNAVVNLKVRETIGLVYCLFHTLCMLFGFESVFWNYHFQKIRPSTSQFGWSSISTVSKVSTLMKECWQSNASARPPMLRAKKTLIGLKEGLQKKISSEKQVIWHFSPFKIAN